MDGRIAGEEAAQACQGVLGFRRQGEQIADDAVVEVDVRGIDGAAVEGLEGSILEVAVDGLRLVKLLGLYVARMILGLPEVVGRLKTQPCVGS